MVAMFPATWTTLTVSLVPRKTPSSSPLPAILPAGVPADLAPGKVMYHHDYRLGSGAFGVVFDAFVGDEKGELDTEERKAIFANEVGALCALDCPNVVRIFGSKIYEKVGYGVIVMEKGCAGDLVETIVSKTTLRRVKNILLGILEGLAAVHDAGLVHRDLKPMNILLSDRSNEARVLVADFGLASPVGADGKAADTHFVGTAGYAAPEAYLRMRVTQACDMFSVGVIALDLIGGKLSFFAGQDHAECARRATRGIPASEFEGADWDGVDVEFVNLLRSLLHPDPYGRPTAQAAAAALRTMVPRTALPAVIRPLGTATSKLRRKPPPRFVEIEIGSRSPKNSLPVELPVSVSSSPAPAPRRAIRRKAVPALEDVLSPALSGTGQRTTIDLAVSVTASTLADAPVTSLKKTLEPPRVRAIRRKQVPRLEEVAVVPPPSDEPSSADLLVLGKIIALPDTDDSDLDEGSSSSCTSAMTSSSGSGTDATPVLSSGDASSASSSAAQPPQPKAPAPWSRLKIAAYAVFRR